MSTYRRVRFGDRRRAHFNGARWLAATLAAVVVLPLTVARSGGVRPPWQAGFPVAAVTLWNGHDRLASWTLPAPIDARVADRGLLH